MNFLIMKTQHQLASVFNECHTWCYEGEYGQATEPKHWRKLAHKQHHVCQVLNDMFKATVMGQELQQRAWFLEETADVEQNGGAHRTLKTLWT